MRSSFRMFAMLLAGFAPVAHGYELRTHALMTQEATLRSVMFTGRSIDLGLFNNPDLGKIYADIGTPSDVRIRFANAYEQGFFPPGLGDITSFNTTARAWIMRGVIREDDGGNLAGWAKKEPRDDPFQNFNRFCSHFFDPWFNRALTADCKEAIVEKAPNWAIGTDDAFAANVVPKSGYPNHFTTFTAREAMFRALTMKSSVTGDDLFPQGSSDALVWQKIYWATTFRALGDVMHVIQDSAQPQHTRNESHYPENMGYEEHIDQRAAGSPVAVFDVATQSIQMKNPPPLAFWGRNPEDNPDKPYPTPKFNRYSDFLATTKAEGDLSGKGIGNYSNREFFTVGTSIGRPSSYPYPPRDPSTYDAQMEVNCELAPQRGFKLYGNVTDKQTGLVDRIRMQSFSLLARSYQRLNLNPVFTLDPCVYDDYASVLLPRAVSYSAGVMDYFFRGQLKIELPPEQVYAVEDFATYADANAGFKTLKMMVKNITPDIGADRQLTDPTGHLYAVLRFRRNPCLQYPALNGAPYKEYSDGQLIWDNVMCRKPSVSLQPFPEIIVSNKIDAPADLDNNFQEVVFTFPTALPFNALDVDLQVVYHGKLGTENNAVAVGFEHISEPNFLNFDNNNDCLKPTTCPYGDASTNCAFNLNARLPFINAAPQPGWRPVVTTNLGAGEYSRVAFLTRTAFRLDLGGGFYDEVLKNQEFPYTVIVTWTPGGDTETWQPGQQISYFGKSRKLNGSSGGGVDSFAHRGYGVYGSDCGGGRQCGGFEWANTMCAPIPPLPKRLTAIMFPNP